MLHVLAPHISCVVTEESFDEALKVYSEVYIICKGGKILRHVKLSGGRHIRVEVKEIPGLKEELKELTPEIAEEVNFLPNGKIPFTLLEEIVQFFKEVMTIKKAEQEAMAHILYNQKDAETPNKGYRIAIPNQVVSKASVKYESDHIKPGDIIVLDIHSHNTMGAFFSSTDNSDDKKGIYYAAVVGHLDKKDPQIISRLNIHDVKKEASIEDIFMVPTKEIKVPSEWLDRVKTMSYIYSGKQNPASSWGGRRESRNGAGRRGGNGKPPYQYDFSSYEDGVAEVYADLYTDADLEADHRLALEHMGIPWMGRGEQEDEIASREIIVRNPNMDKREPTALSPEGRISYGKREEEEEKESDGLQLLTSGDYEYHCAEYGKDVADAYEQIEVWIPELEGNDELLLCVISNAYMLLSTDGQSKLAQVGL